MQFFILGSHPTLSVAEICAVIGDSLGVPEVRNEVLFASRETDDAQALMNRLGGVQKIGVVLAELSYAKRDELPALLVELMRKTGTGEGKISYGLSLYPLENDKRAKELRGIIPKWGIEMKKILRELGRPVRFVSSKEPELSTVIVQTNKMMETGGEWVLFCDGDTLKIGRTQAVQDFRAWSDRDFGRPARDARSGMLPPKLARMMINLSGGDPGKSRLLDPFCGSGTVLMEAALMGYRSLVGSDNSEKAIEDTGTNLDWVQTKLGITLPPLQLIHSSAVELPKRLPEAADVIVTETFLGPSRHEEGRGTKTSRTELVELYASSFVPLRRMLKPGGRAVVAFPAFKRGDGYEHLPLKFTLQKAGWKITTPLPETTPAALRALTPNGGLLYARADQFVAREILILQTN